MSQGSVVSSQLSVEAPSLRGAKRRGNPVSWSHWRMLLPLVSGIVMISSANACSPPPPYFFPMDDSKLSRLIAKPAAQLTEDEKEVMMNYKADQAIVFDLQTNLNSNIGCTDDKEKSFMCLPYCGQLDAKALAAMPHVHKDRTHTRYSEKESAQMQDKLNQLKSKWEPWFRAEKTSKGER